LEEVTGNVGRRGERKAIGGGAKSLHPAAARTKKKDVSTAACRVTGSMEGFFGGLKNCLNL
jgi:hypothetical protein